jgi:hypothetical protein
VGLYREGGGLVGMVDRDTEGCVELQRKESATAGQPRYIAHAGHETEMLSRRGGNRTAGRGHRNFGRARLTRGPGR